MGEGWGEGTLTVGMNTTDVYDSLHPLEMNLLAAFGQSADTPASEATFPPAAWFCSLSPWRLALCK